MEAAINSSYRASKPDWHYRRSKNPKLKRRLIIASLLLLGLCCYGIIHFGGRLVSPANRDIGPPPSNIPFQEIAFASDSGAEVRAWYAASPNSKGTAILVHPIRGSRNSMMNHAYLMYGHGYSVLTIDLQAHGETMGKQITLGHLERYDVVAAIDFIKSKAPNDKIVVIGRSLGGAAALLAAPQNIDALVIESVYPTISQAVDNRVRMRLGPLSPVITPLLTWQIPTRLGISLEDLQPIDGIRKLNCPVLILAGQNDQRTTIHESQELFEAANEPKQMKVVEKAKHEDFLRFAPDVYEETVMAFLAEHISSDVPPAESTFTSDTTNPD